jgi:hypothetical protein
MIVECAREQDVLDALTTSQWPERVNPELRTHVAECRMCSDLVEVVRPVLDDRETDWQETRIPSSAVMWWRAQMRARKEAASAAAHPITIAQVLAASAAILLSVAVVTVLSPWLSGWVGRLASTLAIDLSSLRVPAMLLQTWSQNWLLLSLLTVSLMLAPLAIYFALADD